MKPYILLLLLINFPSLSFGQRDTSNVQSRLKQIEQNLLRKNEALVKRNDSLEREQRYYKAKEEFFYTALGDQSTRFSMIVGGIIAVATGLTFFGYANMLKRVKETKDYVDKREQAITVRSDRALKVLKRESEKIDFDRLEGIYKFYNSLVMNHVKYNFAEQSSPAVTFMDKLFECGLCLQMLDSLMSLHISPLTTDEYSEQEVINKIKYCCSVFSQTRDKMEPSPNQPTMERNWLFSRHNVSVEIIDKTIDKAKSMVILPELFKLRSLIEEVRNR